MAFSTRMDPMGEQLLHVSIGAGMSLGGPDVAKGEVSGDSNTRDTSHTEAMLFG